MSGISKMERVNIRADNGIVKQCDKYFYKLT